MSQEKALVLRTCKADGTSYGDFQWPTEIGSIVKCPDWKPTKECGNGLHGLLDGLGDLFLLSSSIDAIWQVVEVDRSQCIELGGKVKFPECKLVYSGDMLGALMLFVDYNVQQLKSDDDCAGLVSTEDYSHLAASGYNSRLAASGYYSQLAASGTNSQLAASGNNSQLAASGTNSQLAASGNNSQLAASGNNSQLAASGDFSRVVTSGYYCRLSASGKGSIVMCAGDANTVSAGENGTIVLSKWNNIAKRHEVRVGYIGENGLKPNVAYELDQNFEFVEFVGV